MRETGNKRRQLGGLGVAAAVAALTMVSGGGVGQAQEAAILGADEPGAIEGSYIVVLNNEFTTQSVDATANSVADRHGGTIERTYSSAIRGYSASMSETEAKRTAADPKVAYVEQNQVVTINADQLNPPSWGLDRVDQRNLPLDDKYSYSTTASNVDAYIIDTGIRISHNDFGGRAQHGYDFVDNDGNASDCNGHGTHVAGTVGGSSYGLAKGVNLYGVRVLNCQGSGSYAGVIDGIDWVTSNASGPSVANMSLGGGVSTAVDDAVRRSIASGVTYALAAGNSDANACNSSPARTREAITVGSTTRNDSRSSFSNYGTCLDIFAPGSGITSAWIGSDSDSNTISGTSMASPHVAGGAALYLADNPSATPAQVRDALVNNGTKGKVSDPGSGSPNVLLYTGDGGTTPPDPDPEPEPGDCVATTNGTNVSIPDGGSAVTSAITISGCDRNASSTMQVEVHVNHSYRGDVVIDLVAPDGATARLKNSNGYDSANNVNETYTVDASTKAADGTWKLRVQDVYRYDTGNIDSWTITP